MNLRPPGPKPGASTSRSYPRECPAGVEPACPAWEAGASAARPRAHRSCQRKEGESNPQGSRSAVFETAAVADRLALPDHSWHPNRRRATRGGSDIFSEEPRDGPAERRWLAQRRASFVVELMLAG